MYNYVSEKCFCITFRGGIPYAPNAPHPCPAVYNIL